MGQTRTLCMWSSPSLSLFFSFSSRAYFSTSSLDQVMPLRVPEVNMDIPPRNITCWLELELSAPTTLDISSMLFESTTERVFYVVTLASSFFSVCMSFTKLAKVLSWALPSSFCLAYLNYPILLFWNQDTHLGRRPCYTKFLLPHISQGCHPYLKQGCNKKNI